MTDWNYADVWETVADALPEAAAVVQGGARTSWSEFDRRADGVAAWLLSLGVTRQDTVALYLYNTPEYLEGIFATVKVGLVPVNTNYRYTDDELVYLWNNAEAVAVILHGSLVECAGRIRDRVPSVKGWLWVDDGTAPCPAWAVPYEQAARSAPGRTVAPWGRSGDDLILLYTGGTTGMPKGVMWRQDDLFARLNSTGMRRYDPDAGIEGIRKEVEANGAGMSLLPACPLMHGTGSFTAVECLAEAGSIVLLQGRSFDPAELLDTIARERVNGLVIVGDPFARPILAALDARPGHWDLSSLAAIVSSGAMWSEPVKEALLGHHPTVLLVDVFSSSEALGMGASVSSGETAAQTAEFVLGPNVKVFSAEGQPVTPGSDEIGVLALGGRNPLGYFKDAEKTAATFKVIDGVRYSIPGDYAQVHEDGSIHLLGRGSVCINTGGEKVYPEEVEEALKTDPSVGDAVVVGIPNERFGEEVVAVVEPAPGGRADLDPAALIELVKGHLAHYKAPRRVRVVDTLGRAANGKIDYGRHQREAAEWAGGAETS